MASMKKTKTSNKVLFDTIRELVKTANKSESKVFRAVANKLSTTASQRSMVNVSKIQRNTKTGETVIVPGKVLGDGTISNKVTVVGFSASESAISKIEKAGGKFITIKDYIAKNPKDKPKILG